MKTMSREEALAFLVAKPRTGKLATVRADGRPHVAPVWFGLNGNQLIFTTWHTTVKAANLRRDGRIALCVDDEQPPYAFVIVEGQAVIDEDPQELLAWATHIAGRYLGADQAEAYGKRNGVPGELLVRVTIDKLIGRNRIAD